jgi:1-acyl-sn-glycerol-3-phosphate acyltransferase
LITKSLADAAYWLVALFLRLIFRLNGGLNVRGAEKIPHEGGVIIAANHISYLDPPLLGAVLPRRATFMAREGLFDIPLLGWFIGLYSFPVARDRTHPSTIKEAVRRLKNGEMLVIFPEGRRSETGRLQEGKRGVGMIARLSNAAIIPTLVVGTNRALPVNGKWLNRAAITIEFDNPVYPSSIYGTREHPSEEITRYIMKGIRDIRDRYANNSG